MAAEGQPPVAVGVKRTRVGKCFARAAVVVGFLWLVAAGVADAQSFLGESEARAMTASGRVEADLVAALETQGTAPVLIELARDRSPSSRAASVRARLQARLAAADFAPRSYFSREGFIAAEVSAAGLLALLDDPSVVAVGPDRGGRAALSEAVPLVGGDRVASLGFSGEGVTVAVIDSGYDSSHPALSDDLVGEHCFCLSPPRSIFDPVPRPCCPNGDTSDDGSGSAADEFGHGSHVAGIVTSSGVTAPRGMAPDARVVAVRVLDKYGRFALSSYVVSAMDWVLNHRPDVRVINMSLGVNKIYGGDCDNADTTTRALRDVVADLRDAGVLVVAAAGNDGSTTRMGAPACISDVVSVAAVWDSDVGELAAGYGCDQPSTEPGEPACFSNSSPTTDLFAPGALITSVRLGGGSSTQAGTSQASPMVVGCAALLLQINPALTPGELEAALKTSPTTVERGGLSFPLLDCAAAAASIMATTTTTTSTSTSTLPPVLCGDANGDGLLSSVDALWVLKAAVGGAPSCPAERCDADGQPGLFAADALAVLSKAVGLPLTLQCPSA